MKYTNTSAKIIILSLLGVIAVSALVVLLQKNLAPIAPTDAFSNATPNISKNTESGQPSNSTTLTEQEKAGIIQMREEEKLARDVYTTLGNIWGTPIFQNIASSEQTHTDAVKTLLTQYNIEDPVRNNTIGVFTSPIIQDLYDKLTTRGKTSLREALVVGALIEDLDIRDLDTLIDQTNKSDILTVYSNLQKGSRNHMRSFVRNIEANGGTYTPSYISQSEYDSILNSSQERGGQFGR
ncbi:MAG: DUF2202 domain-containing protein [Candidatus Pacebacteria bacterium]|nr:DUF2202 domain-containing protein [Candidatus Paceibacterota bacterium]